MKIGEILNKLIQIILSIISRPDRRRQRRREKKTNKEIDKLEKLYKEALRTGNVSRAVYYRELIDMRLRNIEL